MVKKKKVKCATCGADITTQKAYVKALLNCNLWKCDLTISTSKAK